jgi:hypothetical protein
MTKVGAGILIADDLRRYAGEHGTWDGVAATVSDLSRVRGQGIRLVTASGAVLADSDSFSGRTPRPVTGEPQAPMTSSRPAALIARTAVVFRILLTP